MLGKNFVYILVRRDGLCYKIGHTASIEHRARRLHKNFGPFSSERSFVIRTDTKQDAAKLEASFRHALKSFRFTFPGKGRRDGHTEWFTGHSLELFLRYRDSFLELQFGDGYIVDNLDFESLAPLSAKDTARLRELKKRVRDISPQLAMKSQNAEAIRRFRSLLKGRRADLIGILKKTDQVRQQEHLEVFVQPETCLAEEARHFFDATRIGSDNDQFWGYTNFCDSVIFTAEYQKLTFRFHLDGSRHESTWESEGNIKILQSLLNEFADEYPLPADFRD